MDRAPANVGDTQFLFPDGETTNLAVSDDDLDFLLQRGARAQAYRWKPRAPGAEVSEERAPTRLVFPGGRTVELALRGKDVDRFTEAFQPETVLRWERVHVPPVPPEAPGPLGEPA